MMAVRFCLMAVMLAMCLPFDGLHLGPGAIHLPVGNRLLRNRKQLSTQRQINFQRLC